MDRSALAAEMIAEASQLERLALASQMITHAHALEMKAGRRGLALKSIDSLIQGYIDDLTSAFLDVLDNKMSAPAAERNHRLILENVDESVYDEGMKAGGADPADKDDIDEANLSDWESEEESHIEGFWDDVAALRSDHNRDKLTDEEYTDQQRVVNDRIGLWGASLRDLAGKAKAYALENMTVTWHYGDTDHCATCQELNGQTHRLKWFTSRGYIPQENGSETLDCHGYKCQCELRDQDDNVILPA